MYLYILTLIPRLCYAGALPATTLFSEALKVTVAKCDEILKGMKAGGRRGSGATGVLGTSGGKGKWKGKGKSKPKSKSSVGSNGKNSDRMEVDNL